MGGGIGSSTDLMEPFVIVPIVSDGDDDEDGGVPDQVQTNSTSSALPDSDGSVVDEEGGDSSRVELPPIIFPELMAGSEEMRRLSELAKKSRKVRS